MANTLFPILDNPLPNNGDAHGCDRNGGSAPAKGLARLAADAEDAGEGHQIRFHALTVRSALNNSVSKRNLWFAKTINPYRGCEFACRYCYARYTHEFLNFSDPAAFEHEIYLKQNLAWLLQQELRTFHKEHEIAIGTATDPYQPVERQARITRSVLEVLARQTDLRIGLVTKSTLIERDIDLLSEIARRNTLTLHITITTTDATLARKLEPRAPRPDLRFRTVARLRAAGLFVGVLCSPLLPGITDNVAALNAVATEASRRGACFFGAEPVFLKTSSRETFFRFVREHFPALAPSYERRFLRDAFVSTAYRARIREMVGMVASRHGLAYRSLDAILTKPDETQAPKLPCQASLWPEANMGASA